jgi:hypothetical protein
MRRGSDALHPGQAVAIRRARPADMGDSGIHSPAAASSSNLAIAAEEYFKSLLHGNGRSTMAACSGPVTEEALDPCRRSLRWPRRA